MKIRGSLSMVMRNLSGEIGNLDAGFIVAHVFYRIFNTILLVIL